MIVQLTFVKPVVRNFKNVKYLVSQYQKRIVSLPTEFQSIPKLERTLIAKRILLKKVTVMSHRQMEKITRTICNVTEYDIDISNLLPRTADGTGLVIVNFKRKLEY